MRRYLVPVMLVLVFCAGFVVRGVVTPVPVFAQASGRVFEIRTYTTNPGKLANLHRRFRDHTLRIFAKHGMTNVVYFSPTEGPLAENTLIYVLAHASRDAAKKSWADFAADPEWQKVAADSQVDGRIVSKVESVFADATDYSPLK
jgi:hypothetical protein